MAAYREALRAWGIPDLDARMAQLAGLVGVLAVEPEQLVPLINGTLRLDHRWAGPWLEPCWGPGWGAALGCWVLVGVGRRARAHVRACMCWGRLVVGGEQCGWAVRIDWGEESSPRYADACAQGGGGL